MDPYRPYPHPQHGPPPGQYGRPPPGFGGPPQHGGPGGYGPPMNGGPPMHGGPGGMHGGPPPMHGGPPPMHGGHGGPPPMHHNNSFRPGPPMQQPHNPQQQFDRRPPFGGYDDRRFDRNPNMQRVEERPQIPLPPRRAPTAEDKLTTVFVAGIVDGVSDAWMEKILQTCGPIRSWRRMQDASGKPKGFGFCVYEQPESVSRALRILNGEGEGVLSEGIELFMPGGQPKKLKCNVDDVARKHVESYRSQRADAMDEQRDRELRDQILTIAKSLGEDANQMDIDSLIMSAVADGTGRGGSPDTPGGGRGTEEMDDLPAEMAPEQRELISREIMTFRERSAAKDRKKKEDEERRMMERDQADRRSRRQADQHQHHAGPRGGYHGEAQQQGGHYGAPRQSFAHHNGKEEDDEEEYERRQQRREAEAREAFLDRERRWLQQEEERLKWLAACAAETNDMNDANGVMSAKAEEMGMAMAEWNGDADLRTDEDRRSFFARMQRQRRAEFEMDREDREAEKAEQERKNAEPEPMEEDETPAAPKEIVIGKIMTKEERHQAIQDLISIIPAEKAGLWDWHIKWDYLEESIVTNKLRPWVTKKIVEYIGEEDKDLVEFVIELLQKRSPAEEVLNEMQPALDEEAEAFVMVLWRMLIYETEARSQGLG